MRGGLLAAWLVAFGCAFEAPETDPRLLTGTLVIDSEFSAEQRAGILSAVELWRQATQQRFAPEVVIGDVECGQAFAIEAVHEQGCHVGQEVEDERDATTQRVLGAADRRAHWVSVVTWLEGSHFQNNVAHELGHYLLIGHGEGIMAQAREHEPPRVAAASLAEFCAVWGCDPRGLE